MKITDPSQVKRALVHDHLVPPPAPDTLGTSATAQLRNAMARFNFGEAHLRARRDVDAAVAAIDLRDVYAATSRLTTEEVTMREHCDMVADIGFVVPTEALAATLGVPSADLAEVRRYLRSIVIAIGRGEAATDVTDTAARRLLDRFAHHPGGAVATVSMLYQNHDATAALLASTLLGRARSEPRRNALARTVRTATADLAVDALEVPANSTIEIGLEADGHEFGAGPHACPGSEIATTIVAAICDTMDVHGWGVDLDRAEFAPDGRARTLPRRLLDTRPT